MTTARLLGGPRQASLVLRPRSWFSPGRVAWYDRQARPGLGGRHAHAASGRWPAGRPDPRPRWVVGGVGRRRGWRACRQGHGGVEGLGGWRHPELTDGGDPGGQGGGDPGGQGGGGRRPLARRAAWVRSAACSLSRMRDTWFCTVFSDTPNDRAICRLLAPPASRSRTSRSRPVSCSWAGGAGPAGRAGVLASSRLATPAPNTAPPAATVRSAAVISWPEAPLRT